MKKILILISVLIILFSVSAYATDFTGTEYENIKIGLFFDSTAKKSVTLNSDSGFIVGYTTENLEFVEIAQLEQTELYVLIDDDGFLNVSGVYQNTLGYPLEFYSFDNIVKVNGSAYRGFIILKQTGSSFSVINEVNIEEYLYSVIGKEMSPSWHKEALKAQAICARTYAINNWKKYASKGFNLCATQLSQVYPGISNETASTIEAVEETRGQIVKYDGKIAQTFFYSSSGGKTANVKYVWGSNFPYLVSVDDTYEDEKESSSNWTVTLSKSDIEKKLKNAGVDIGSVTGIKIDKVDNGTVYEVIIKGTKGEYTLKNERTRTFLGLKSQYYTILENGTNKVSIKETANGFNGFIKGNALNLLESIDEEKETLSDFVESDTFTFSGHGWGHRIGMSQFGAKKMAESGFSAEEILTHYFPGTTVE